MRSFVWGVLLAGAIAVLQSTVLRFIAIAGVQPDLVLIVVIFLAHKNGSMIGQLVGFVAGVVIDSFGLAPLGFHALIYTVLGAAFGVTRGKIFVDAVFLPLLFGVVAVLVKGLLALALSGLYSIDPVASRILAGGFLIEIGYTAIVVPILFGILSLFKALQPDRRKGEVV
jgi:rod shape-determining protein MreD